jgi:UV DNA damage repair endonuclease
MTINKKIGFACKFIDSVSQVDGIKSKDNCAKYNTGTTTRAWVNRQSRSIAEEKLWDLMKDNIESVKLLVEKVGTFEPHLRMLRISSDVLPLYTEKDWSYFYHQPDVISYMERHFKAVGDAARRLDVRLSFHPGQFCVLASENPNIVNNSIDEFEYHTDMARYMGFGKSFQDFKINVHISGKLGPDGIRAAYNRLSPEARNCITIENEENSWGIDDCLKISDLVPIVLDIHHHFCREGEYIQVNDDRVKRVIDSWRGVRPVCHYSQSREDLLVGHSANSLPDMKMLLAAGYSKQKLRAHSDFMWNKEANKWANTFWDHFDVMVEAKAKNLASDQLAKSWINV